MFFQLLSAWVENQWKVPISWFRNICNQERIPINVVAYLVYLFSTEGELHNFRIPVEP